MLVLIGGVLNHARRPGHCQEKGASLTCRGGSVQKDQEQQRRAQGRSSNCQESRSRSRVAESGSDDGHGKSDQLQRTGFAVAGPDVPSPDRKVAASRETFLLLATVVFCGRRRFCVASSCEPLLASFHIANMNISQPVSSQIGGVEFAFLPSEEIRALSVKRITNPTTFDTLLNPVPGGLYDAALGNFGDNS